MEMFPVLFPPLHTKNTKRAAASSVLPVKELVVPAAFQFTHTHKLLHTQTHTHGVKPQHTEVARKGSN